MILPKTRAVSLHGVGFARFCPSCTKIPKEPLPKKLFLWVKTVANPCVIRDNRKKVNIFRQG